MQYLQPGVELRAKLLKVNQKKVLPSVKRRGGEPTDLRLTQHQTHNRRDHQNSSKDRKRKPVASGDVEQKSKERRSNGRQDLRNQNSYAANLAQRKPAEIIGPQNIRQYYIATKANPIKKKPNVNAE